MDWTVEMYHVHVPGSNFCLTSYRKFAMSSRPAADKASLNSSHYRHTHKLHYSSICCGFVGHQIVQQAVQHVDISRCRGFVVRLRFLPGLFYNLLWMWLDFRFLDSLYSTCCTASCTTNPQQIEVSGVWVIIRSRITSRRAVILYGRWRSVALRWVLLQTL